MWFTRISLRNPVLATMMMAALVVLGLFSLQRLKVDQFPNIDFPVVVVTTEYPGASPEVVEIEVTRKIEETVNAISGINTLTPVSYTPLTRPTHFPGATLMGLVASTHHNITTSVVLNTK